MKFGDCCDIYHNSSKLFYIPLSITDIYRSELTYFNQTKQMSYHNTLSKIIAEH